MAAGVEMSAVGKYWGGAWNAEMKIQFSMKD
jgi:hypothetical protein